MSADPSPTLRQLEVLRVIDEHQRVKKYPITIRELGERLGLTSTNGVNDHLKALEKKGLVERVARTARALLITTAGRSWLTRGAA
jgi:repressor LexA